MRVGKRHPKLPRRSKPMPQIISRIPWHDGMSRDELDEAITKELLAIWYSAWSAKELQLQAEMEAGQHDELLPGVCSKLDGIILKQAESLGWRLLISSQVLRRISMWDAEESGSDLFVRLGKALGKSVRIVQGKELPPIDDPDLIPTQIETTRELRAVLREMRKVFSGRRTGAHAGKVLECFGRIVSNSGTSYPLLKANLPRWQRWWRRLTNSPR